jgi:hypothetical protein
MRVRVKLGLGLARARASVLLVSSVWGVKPIHHDGPVMELPHCLCFVEQHHIFDSHYHGRKKVKTYVSKATLRFSCEIPGTVPGSLTNKGWFFIASMNASKSFGVLKVQAFRLRSMLRLGL